MTDTLGGGELATLALAQALQRYTDVAVVSHPTSPLLGAAEARGIPIETLDLGHKLSRRNAIQAVAQFPRMRHRLLSWLNTRLSAHDWCCLQYKWEELLWAGTSVLPKIVICEHGPIPAALTNVKTARRRLSSALNAAEMVWAWSEPAQESVAALSIPSRRLDAGVDPEEVALAQAQRDGLRAQFVSTGGGPVIAYVGRLTADKGVDLAIRSLTAVPDAVMVVAGDGPDGARLKQLASSLNVERRVQFLGHVDSAMAVIAAADVLLLLTSSPGEGRPLSALEACAVGTPVLGSPSPAITALAAEGMARVMSDCTPGALGTAIRGVASLPRAAIDVQSWDATARQFLRVANPSIA